MRVWTGIVTAAVLPLSAATLPAQDRLDLTIRLGHGSEAEGIMARQLDALLAKYDLEPWVLTRVVRIDERSIPHSHPVLTLHTRHIGEELLRVDLRSGPERSAHPPGEPAQRIRGTGRHS